ncbi:hypothetical protein LRAMOSA11026 [Lichtheimia ramosa]|uniref:Zn(2)-C6 fungal-type domain-containing protein n=1 Tax=Lichtheimia ramosa TaxID=688394 RepID=A0A077WT97_9FUNG|nr:hypothetical protein LRAMOSA11026 [Lichtheimia ramosa]
MSFQKSSHHSTNLQCILGEESRLHYAVMHKNIQDTAPGTIPPPSLCKSKSTGSFSSHVTPPRRLSSGSACEICRRRKTKCDGGNPCAFCSANRIECVHRATRRKKSSLAISQTNNDLYKPSSSKKSSTAAASTSYQLTPSPTASSWTSMDSTPSPATLSTFPSAVGSTSTANKYNMEGYIKSHLSKQTSCPSLIVSTHWSPNPQQHPADPGSTTPVSATAAAAAVSAVATNQQDNPYSRTKTEMPSMMDQLSCRTFSAVVDHRTDYPIYPLSHSTASHSGSGHSSTSHHDMMVSGNVSTSTNHDKH